MIGVIWGPANLAHDCVMIDRRMIEAVDFAPINVWCHLRVRYGMYRLSWRMPAILPWLRIGWLRLERNPTGELVLYGKCWPLWFWVILQNRGAHMQRWNWGVS